MNDDAEPTQILEQKFVPVCAIGASAGGVDALRKLFQQLPTDLGLAYVIIIHLAPDHSSTLSEILAGCTRMPVSQITDGPTLKPNHVYVIAPDRELVIKGDHVVARVPTEPRGRRSPIDMFFNSIAAARGDGIAVILSGAGADGTAGIRAIKAAGGVIMVQDPAESEFDSMPRNAVNTELADFVAPLARLAEQLADVARSKEAVRSLDAEGSANELRRIVAFLRTRTGHDFAGYKRATVMRRVLRRMQVCRAKTLAAYADYLVAVPQESGELLSDLLISVTSFFREPHAFEALQRDVIVRLFDEPDLDTEEGIRIWVPGCATGEEAYSIAMLLHEEAARRKLQPRFQIFASDLDERALATAREGRYPRLVENDLSKERLARFFRDDGTHFRVRGELRESVLFARHSVIKDPPFTRMDLISCRNLLIYLERSLQQQLHSVFHYSLKPGRFLFLGSAETTDAAADLFSTTDRENRIYRTRPHAGRGLPVLSQLSAVEQRLGGGFPAPVTAARAGSPSVIHASALEMMAPASALIDDGLNIVHLSPSAGRFLLHAAGPISSQLLAIVRPELQLNLGAALARALEHREPTVTPAISVNFDGQTRRISMHVLPIAVRDNGSPQIFVFFLDGGHTPPDTEPDPLSSSTAPDTTQRLRIELREVQEALLDSQTGHQTVIQDLRLANEELQSTNEEYRSTAEELETSKEELQSINEELHTVNAELKSKLASISVAHNNLQNLTAATEIGTLFLDPDLRIRMFTAPIAALFSVTQADMGRLITDFTHRLADPGIVEDVRQVLQHLAPTEREVRTTDGAWYIMRVRPYRTLDDRIDGSVVTFVDISTRLRAERALSRSEEQLRALVQVSSQALYRMSPDWDEVREVVGDGFLTGTGHQARSWLEHYIPAEDQPKVRAVIETATANKATFELEHRVRRADGTLGWMVFRAIPVLDDAGAVVEWFGSASDTTARKRAEDALRESEVRQRVMIEGVPQLVWRSTASGQWTWASPQWTAFTGQAEADSHGMGWLDCIHPDDRLRVVGRWQEAQSAGFFEIDCRIFHAGESRHRWFQTRARPLYDDAGIVTEWLGTSTDVDELRMMSERQEVMVAELQHRTRNLLAVVHNIARRSIDPSPQRDQFDARLGALGRVQGFLSRSFIYSVPLADLVEAELQAAGDGASDRVDIGGPAVTLPGDSVQAIALALHELATNAVKYGAIAQSTGHLSVTWEIETAAEDGTPRLVIDWCETKVEMGEMPPLRRGYGSELITRALPYQLQAETALEFTSDGVKARIVLPSSAFSEITGEAR